MNKASNSDRNTARIVGALFLIPIGFINNMVLLGPYTFAKDYLMSVATHSSQVTLAMILGIIDGIISITIASLLLPIFRKYSETLAFAFLSFSIVNFVTIVIDNVSIQSLLTLSKEYVKSGTADANHIQTLGVVAYATRLWTHWMTILIPCLSSSVFFYLLFKSRLLPRFISILGLISTALMALAILLMIFDKGSYMWLMVPFGLNGLLLTFWLLLKGFNPSDNTSSHKVRSTYINYT